MKEMKGISTKPVAENKSAKPICFYEINNTIGISGISTKAVTEGKISEVGFALPLKS